MNKLYDIVEVCLTEIEQGADIDTILFRYPEYADELRPILETSVKAMEMAVVGPSIAMTQISRAELLKRAAQMRQAKTKRTSRFWFASLRRVAVTFVVLLLLFASGNGLVRASSNTIPGDNLYPVKRTWEDMLVLFAFNSQHREALEFEYENERLEELEELFTEGRTVKVDFAGYVTNLTPTEWQVSGITILIAPQTVLPNTAVTVGAGIRIIGVSQSNRSVLAERIESLPAGSILPPVGGDGTEIEQETSEGMNQPEEQESTSWFGTEAPQVRPTNTPGTSHDTQEPENDESAPEGQLTTTPQSNPTSKPTVSSSSPKFEIKDFSFEGTLQAMNGDTWTINGRSMNVSKAEISGKPVIGAYAKVEAYYNSSGALIAKHIEIKSSSSKDGDSKDGEEHRDRDHED